MSEAVPVAASAAVVSKKATKAVKPAAASKKEPAKHPKFAEMISAAIVKLAERGGSSKQAILKYIIANYKIDEKLANQHLKVALKSGVKNGEFKQTKGVGASGSFKVVEKKKAAAKKPSIAKKVVKPKVKTAAKPKKVTTTTAKKPAAATAKSPAKPKAKPAAVAKPKAEKAKKPAAPKKVVKKVATKEAAKAKSKTSVAKPKVAAKKPAAAAAKPKKVTKPKAAPAAKSA